MNEAELMEIRAALSQMIKAHERLADGEKRILAIIEKRLGLRPNSSAPSQELSNATIAGVMGPSVTTT